MPFKILFLTPGCFDKGGISRYSRYQISALRDIVGLDQVRALSLLGPDQDSFETPFEVSWHSTAQTTTIAGHAGFVWQALQQAILWKPDVIHCAHVNLTPLATQLKALCGATTVLNVYGLEIWSGLSNIRRSHMARMDYVIADCHATADHVTSKAMHPKTPTVIWDCVDLNRFRPGPMAQHLIKRYGLPDKDRHRIVMTLGRLAVKARHKGYYRLLDIMNDVCAHVPNAHLVIAGHGDDVKQLQARAGDLHLANRVTFTGPIHEQDLAAIYRTAHVFALVSDKGIDRGEGIPLTPLEAMATGLPILVGNEDGSREAVENNRNGIVTSPRDLAAITQALVTLLTETGAARATRIAEARHIAEARFGYHAFVDKHRRFYAKLAPLE